MGTSISIGGYHQLQKISNQNPIHKIAILRLLMY